MAFKSLFQGSAAAATLIASLTAADIGHADEHDVDACSYQKSFVFNRIETLYGDDVSFFQYNPDGTITEPLQIVEEMTLAVFDVESCSGEKSEIRFDRLSIAMELLIVDIRSDPPPEVIAAYMDFAEGYFATPDKAIADLKKQNEHYPPDQLQMALNAFSHVPCSAAEYQYWQSTSAAGLDTAGEPPYMKLNRVFLQAEFICPTSG
jgi:hypothetical protein